ncbi:MAG: histidine phosphatase family protein [Pseudaminobacter sp.]|nr:histidine phosphatase family protein [Pseudaminobacter sp.]
MLRAAVILLSLTFVAPVQATEAGWALLREGEQVVLMRHAMSPGAAEPAAFSIDDCKTQRRLSDRGRQQARKIGSLFSARAASTERVLSSRYCRALETGAIAFRDNEVEPVEALDLLKTDEQAAAGQVSAVMEEIRAYSGSGNLVMITHLENIKALTGVTAREGEAVIVRPEGDGLHVLGRVVFN